MPWPIGCVPLNCAGSRPEEAGVSHRLLDPGFVASHLYKQRRKTRIEFGDFDDDNSPKIGSRNKRKLQEFDSSAEEKNPAGYQGDYGEMFKDLMPKERPGFLESLPNLPQYEPESDEFARDYQVGGAIRAALTAHGVHTVTHPTCDASRTPCHPGTGVPVRLACSDSRPWSCAGGSVGCGNRVALGGCRL